MTNEIQNNELKQAIEELAERGINTNGCEFDLVEIPRLVGPLEWESDKYVRKIRDDSATLFPIKKAGDSNG